jgi:hypothetical protein
MKQFRFKYSPLVLVLIGLVLVISLLGLGFNIFNIIVTKEQGFKLISYYIIVVLTAFILILAISIAIYGKYKIKNGYLYSYFGFILSKIKVEDIAEIVHFKDSDKLVLYTKDNAYTIIVIDPKYYNDFVLSIREENSKIKFDIKIKEINEK